MIFLIIGMVTCINFCQALAPSIEAASYKSSGIDFNAAKYMIRKNGAPTQTLTNIIENRDQKVSLSQGMADNPSASNIQLKELLRGLYQIYKESGLKMKMNIIVMKYRNI